MSLRQFIRLFPVVPVAFVAMAASGCSHRSDSGESEYTSIKDNAVRAETPRVVAPQQPARRYAVASAPERSIRLPERKTHSASIARTTNDTPRPWSLRGPAVAAAVDDARPVSRPVMAPSKPAAVASDVKQPAPAMPATVAILPPAAVNALPNPAPVAATIAIEKPAAVPASPTVATAPLTQPAAPIPRPVAAAPAEPKVELIPAPKPSLPTPSVPAAVAPAVKAAVSAKTEADIATGGRPATSKAPQAVPGTTKVASLSEQTRVRDALDRADAYMKNGQIINARALLQDASRGENPDLLAALAATYDPVVLVDYPAVQKAADAKRAVELYDTAISKGSVAAKERQSKLKVYIERGGR